MPTTTRSHRVRPVAHALLVAIVAIVAGACSLLPAGTVPQLPDQVLVTYETSGGECPEGPCGFTAEIHADGTVTRSDGVAQTVDGATLARLAEQMAAANWEAILARPFVGECPKNYDGQESIYTFHVSTEPIVVAGCTTAIDPAQEPFRTVQEILFGVGG